MAAVARAPRIVLADMEGLPDNGLWYGFYFCKVWSPFGEHTGWEVDCRRHGGCGSRCTRTRSIKKYGSETVERLLKHWCCQAWEKGTAQEHKHEAADPPLHELPELQAIEATMAMLWDAHGDPEARVTKRRRRGA